MLNVLIEEEYGFRYWRWLYPESAQQLRDDFKNGIIPLVCAEGQYKGVAEQVIAALADDFYFEEFRHSLIRAHIHDNDDSWLEINGKVFHGYLDKTTQGK